MFEFPIQASDSWPFFCLTGPVDGMSGVVNTKSNPFLIQPSAHKVAFSKAGIQV